MRNKAFKQPTPAMQLTAIRSSLEGHLTNVEEGFSSTQKLFLWVVEEHLKLIEDLEPHLKLARWID
jgi:hypothetical protein